MPVLKSRLPCGHQISYALLLQSTLRKYQVLGQRRSLASCSMGSQDQTSGNKDEVERREIAVRQDSNILGSTGVFTCRASSCLVDSWSRESRLQ